MDSTNSSILGLPAAAYVNKKYMPIEHNINF